MTQSCKVYFSILLAGLSLANCTLPDICEEDADGDGFKNCIDVCPNHFDPSILDEKVFKNKLCSCQDSDADGIIDCLDPCPYHADLEPTDCGCGIEPIGEKAYMTCPEGKGILDRCPHDPDKIAPGVCGCGVSDFEIYWENAEQTIGQPTSTCIKSDPDYDQCPFDDKKEPGKCGCGIPDIDSDGDTILDCNEECPNDPDKQVPGKCGCGVPDSSENLRDRDGDGVVDCLDLCPDNPYKVEPGNTGCEHSDTDRDGLEDQDDFCPYNRNIQTAADLENSEIYLSCNIQLDKENNKLIYEVWTPQELLEANAAFGAFLEHINVSDDEKQDITSHLQLGTLCDADPKPSCFNLVMTDDGYPKSQYVCERYPRLGINLLGYRVCDRACAEDGTYTVNGNPCDDPYNIRFQKPAAQPPSEDKRFVIRLMNDINVYYHLIHQNTFGVANWQGINLHDVELDGNDKKLISQDLEHQAYNLNAPVFKDLINTYVHDLTIDISYQGTGAGTLAQNVTRSIIENVHVNTRMMIQDSIFGDSNNNRSSGFANYAKDSDFRDIDINMEQLHTISPTDFSGFINSAENVNLSKVHLTFEGINSVQSGTFSGVFGSLFGNNDNSTIENLYLNFHNTSTFNQANVNTIVTNASGKHSFKNIYVKIDDFNLNTGNYYGWTANASDIDIDNLYVDIKNIRARDFNALGFIKNASNVWIRYENIDASKIPYINFYSEPPYSMITNINHMDHLYLHIDSINLPLETPSDCFVDDKPTEWCFDPMFLLQNTSIDHFELHIGNTNLLRIYIDAHTLSHGNIYILDSLPHRDDDHEVLPLHISTTIDKLEDVSLFTNAHVDLYRDEDWYIDYWTSVKYYPNAYLGEIDSFVLTQSDSKPYGNLQQVGFSCTNYCQQYLSPNYQDYENTVHACLQKEHADVTWDLRIDPQAACANVYSGPISCYSDKIIENMFCDDIEHRCHEISSSSPWQPLEEFACWEEYYDCMDYFYTYYDPKQETIYTCLEEAIDTYSEYLEHLVDVCSETFTTKCTYLTIKDAYWYRHHDDASAFVAPDSTKLCLNDLWTPFVEADTASIVERLSDGWKAEKIGDRVIPWYTPDTAWIDTLKSTLGVTE